MVVVLSYMTERPTITFEIPESSDSIVFYAYLTTRELRAVREFIYTKTIVSSDGQMKDDGYTADLALRVEDLVIKYLTKEGIVDGNKVDAQVIIENVLNQRAYIGDQVFQKAVQIYRDSEHTSESKKK